MIPVQNYTDAFFIIIASLTVLMSMPLLKDRPIEGYPGVLLKINTGLILTITIAFIGLRDPWGDWRFFGDTSTYTASYERMAAGDIYIPVKDFGFYYFMLAAAKFIAVQWFYVICACIYVLAPYFTFKKWFGQKAIWALLVMVASFSFWSYGINGVRQGLATSLFVAALGFTDRKWLMGLVLALSISFHSSMVVPVLAYIGTFLVKDLRVVLFFWVICLLFAVSVGAQFESFMRTYFPFILDLDPERFANLYANKLDGQKIDRRFRLDFIIVGVIPMLFGLWMVYRKNYLDAIYSRILRTYIVVNGAWLLFIYAAYTNRIAYLSWFLIPLLVVYPLLMTKCLRNQRIVLLTIILFNLLLTLVLTYK